MNLAIHTNPVIYYFEDHPSLADVVEPALEAGCGVVLTNDRDWKSITKVEVLYLEDFLAGGRT